jgi:Coenzyme PQQ synthesis protein D (PqqD)
MRAEKSSLTVFTPLDDGTGVLLNVDTLFYYSLNRTAVTLWKEIEANQSFATDDLVPLLCERFEVDGEAARREIAAFVSKLEQLKFLRAL